ncbi:MAG: AraC family transcriptional regulator [Bacteroidota bacterium]
MTNLPSIPIFSYSQVNYIKWLKDFAGVLGCSAKDNTLTFSPAQGEGFSKSFFLENGFTACVNNYKLNNEHHYTRIPTEKFGVIIYLYYMDNKNLLEYTFDHVPVEFQLGSDYALRIASSQTRHHVKVEKGIYVKGLSIYLEHEWIEKNAHLRVMDVFKYLQKVNYFEQFLNAKQKKLLAEILELPADHPYPAVFVKSRIYRIMDKILETFIQREISEQPERISEEDFKMLQQIESILTRSYEEAFPGIEKLSRISLMSESKLKKLFKQAFGMGLYEYFQRNRMHRAKEYILSGKYSISEVGSKLGYQNLSNFSAAFRKEFQCLPSELAVG